MIGAVPLSQIGNSAVLQSGSASNLSDRAIAWKAAILANGGSISDPTLAAADEFVFLPLEPIASKIRQLLLLCGGNLSAARTAAYGPDATLINIVAGDYSESNGLAPGSGRAIASNIGMTGVNTSNCGIFLYGTGLIDPAQYWMLGGSIDAGSTYTYRLTNANGTLQGRCDNVSDGVLLSYPGVSGDGALSLQSPSSNAIGIYRNATEIISSTVSRTQTPITLAPYYLARNNNGAPDGNMLNTARVFACALTDGLAGVGNAEIALLYNAVRNFNLAIARVGAP